MSSESDKEERSLVERCLCGDGPAWDRFMELHYPKITGIVRWRKWKFDHHEIEEVTQETLEEVIKSLKQFRFQSSLGTYVHKIAVCTCIRQIRKNATEKRSAEGMCLSVDHHDEADDDPAAYVPVHSGLNQEELLLGRERITLLKRALATLDERCKELIRYRFFEDLSFQEMADRMKTKQNTLIVQLKRCMARVLREVQKQGA